MHIITTATEVGMNRLRPLVPEASDEAVVAPSAMLPPSGGRALPRRAVQAYAKTPGAARDRPVPPAQPAVSEADLSLYLAMLDMVLEDRVLHDHEQQQLDELAADWGFDAGVVRQAHETYLTWLIDEALAIRKITVAERADLNRVADLLVVPPSALDRLLEERQLRRAQLGSVAPTPLARKTKRPLGRRVLFLGDLRGPTGEGCSHEDAERLATDAGLLVVDDLSDQPDILVVVATAGTQQVERARARAAKSPGGVHRGRRAAADGWARVLEGAARVRPIGLRQQDVIRSGASDRLYGVLLRGGFLRRNPAVGPYAISLVPLHTSPGGRMCGALRRRPGRYPNRR